MAISKEIVNFETIADILHPWAASERVSIGISRQALDLQGRLTPAVAEAYDKAAEIKKKAKAIFYIAGALTGVDEATKERYEAINDLLSSYGDTFFGYAPHLHGTDPINHPNASPREVRDIDNLWADVAADLHINFLWPIAHGNAIEEGWAEKRMIPAIYFSPRGMSTSRLTRGMENIISIVEYEDFARDGLEGGKLIFDEIAAWIKHYPNRDPKEFFYLSLEAVNTLAQTQQLDLKEDGTSSLDDDVAVYVKDINHPGYGKVGLLRSHYVDFWSWYEVNFGHHRVPFSGNQTFSIWINPEVYVGNSLKVKGLKKLHQAAQTRDKFS